MRLKLKCSPGPFTMKEERGGRYSILDANGEEIAVMKTVTPSLAKANAQLFTAVPELLLIAIDALGLLEAADRDVQSAPIMLADDKEAWTKAVDDFRASIIETLAKAAGK